MLDDSKIISSMCQEETLQFRLFYSDKLSFRWKSKISLERKKGLISTIHVSQKETVSNKKWGAGDKVNPVSSIHGDTTGVSATLGRHRRALRCGQGGEHSRSPAKINQVQTSEPRRRCSQDERAAL